MVCNEIIVPSLSLLVSDAVLSFDIYFHWLLILALFLFFFGT